MALSAVRLTDLLVCLVQGHRRGRRRAAPNMAAIHRAEKWRYRLRPH